MVELIQARIAFHGGREKLIKHIMDEWYPAPDKTIQASINGLQTWAVWQEKILGKQVRYCDIERLAFLTGKTSRAVQTKAQRMGIYVKSSVKH